MAEIFLENKGGDRTIDQMIQAARSGKLANLAITLINQATYLLRRLLEAQQKQFVAEGGIREQMTRARLNYRNQMTKPTSQT